jgi:hypothetical protein
MDLSFVIYFENYAWIFIPLRLFVVACIESRVDGNLVVSCIWFDPNAVFLFNVYSSVKFLILWY